MNTTPAIELSGLTKTFRARRAREVAPWSRVKDFIRPLRSQVLAVDGVSFSIAKGERVAFIGPNGAGKSTTLKILSG